jgi:hypothetical protein
VKYRPAAYALSGLGFNPVVPSRIRFLRFANFKVLTQLNGLLALVLGSDFRGGEKTVMIATFTTNEVSAFRPLFKKYKMGHCRCGFVGRMRQFRAIRDSSRDFIP